MKKIIHIGVALLLLFSCTNKNEDAYVFRNEDFPKTSFLIADTLLFPIPEEAMSLTIIEDSFLLVRRWDGNPYFASLYYLKTQKVLAHFGKKGKGPDELLSAYLGYKSHMDTAFTLFDIIKKKAFVYGLKTLNSDSFPTQPIKFEIPSFIGNDIAFLNKDSCIIYHKYALDSKEFNNHIPELYCFNINKQNDFYSEIENYKYFTHNATDAFIAVHPKKDKIWLIHQEENEIDIFNKKRELIKTLKGPYDFKPTYKLDEYSHYEVDAEIRTRTYWMASYTNRFIYILYFGEYDNIRKYPTNVLKFSWNGDLIHRYILDKDMYTIYIDSKEEYMYGMERNYPGPPNLIRYKLTTY